MKEGQKSGIAASSLLKFSMVITFCCQDTKTLKHRGLLQHGQMMKVLNVQLGYTVKIRLYVKQFSPSCFSCAVSFSLHMFLCVCQAEDWLTAASVRTAVHCCKKLLTHVSSHLQWPRQNDFVLDWMHNCSSTSKYLEMVKTRLLITAFEPFPDIFFSFYLFINI